MKFILAMHSDFQAFRQMTAAESTAFDEGITTFNDALRGAGAWVSAEGIDEPAQTIRFRSADSTVSDGPFANVAERLAGFWIIEAADLAAAVEWATRAPLQNGAIEVRPLVGE